MEMILGFSFKYVDECWQIIFVESKSLEASLRKEISSELLPQEYGGTGQLVLLDKVNIPDSVLQRPVSDS